MTGYRLPDMTSSMNDIDLQMAIRAAFEESGMSVRRLAKQGDIPYATAHAFLVGGADVRLSTATKACRVLKLHLCSKRKR